MKSEAAIDTLETFSRIQGGDLRDAMELGVKALRNQAKYEEALRMACDRIDNAGSGCHVSVEEMIKALATLSRYCKEYKCDRCKIRRFCNEYFRRYPPAQWAIPEVLDDDTEEIQ